MLTALIAMMVSLYLQTHQIVYIKNAELFVYQSYLNKLFLQLKLRSFEWKIQIKDIRMIQA